MSTGYFHCKLIDGFAIALQVDTVDPVTPIALADFVTGAITNPLATLQKPTLFQYDGSQVNGSTDGSMVGVNDQDATLKADILLDTDAVQLQSFTNIQDFPTVTTNDNTLTDIGESWEFPEGKRAVIRIIFDAERTDSFDLYTRELLYVIYRETGGATVIDDENQNYRNGPSNIRGEINLAGNDLRPQVTGRNGQTWNWRIIQYDFRLEDLA